MENSIATKLVLVTTNADLKEVKETYINYNVILERITETINASNNNAITNILLAFKEEMKEIATLEGTVIVMDEVEHQMAHNSNVPGIEEPIMLEETEMSQELAYLPMDENKEKEIYNDAIQDAIDRISDMIRK